MNTNRSFEERWNYLNSLELNLQPEWVQAFIDGEGSFQVRIAEHMNRGKPLLSIAFTLEIAQHTHDVKLLDAIRLYFGHGFLKPKYDITSLDSSKKVRSLSRYISYNTEEIVRFVEKYSMYTRKHLDYLDWKKLIDLKISNTHKSDYGKSYMINIKKKYEHGKIIK